MVIIASMVLKQHLLLKVIADEKQDSILAVHDSFCILKVQLYVLPEHNTFSSLGDKTGRDSGDFRGRLDSKRLRVGVVHGVSRVEQEVLARCGEVKMKGVTKRGEKEEGWELWELRNTNS